MSEVTFKLVTILVLGIMSVLWGSIAFDAGEHRGRCLQFCAPGRFTLVYEPERECWCDDGRKLQIEEKP